MAISVPPITRIKPSLLNKGVKMIDDNGLRNIDNEKSKNKVYWFLLILTNMVVSLK